ncbi:hypothetical protein BH24ACT16_BH24ACT16_16650 [soil metagenome]|jgi:hypothetical protein
MNKEENTRQSLFDRLFAGKVSAEREDRVRDYIVHRVRHGACLKDVLEEEYVQRNCDQDELDEILRDPRLIHEEREKLERFFSDGHLDPALALRRR